MWKNHLFNLQAIAAALYMQRSGLCRSLWTLVTGTYCTVLVFQNKDGFRWKLFFTYLVRFSYMQHLWRTAMVSNILGSLAVSSKCPWGDSRLQFLGTSFAWENISWPLLWLLVPFWGNHRLSLMWLQSALMWTQFSPEVTLGYSWPLVALGWSQITRGTTRGWNLKEKNYYLRLAWPELFSLFLLRVWRISSV